MRTRSWRCALVIAVAGLAAGLAHGGDWPQFGGPERDLHAPAGETVSAWAAAGPKIAWDRELGGGFSAVSAVGDTLYTMWRDDEGEHVGAFEAATGKTTWSYLLDDRVFPDAKGGDGPRATPTIVGDALFTIGAHGVMVSLDRADGSLRWRKDVVKDFAGGTPKFGYSESLLVSHGKVFVVGGSAGQALIALSAADGSVRWKTGDYLAAGRLAGDRTRRILGRRHRSTPPRHPQATLGEVAW